MPHWWTHKAFGIPGPGWHPENVFATDAWFQIGKHGVVEGTMWLNLVGMMMALCLLPLIAMVVFESQTRPPRPAS